MILKCVESLTEICVRPYTKLGSPQPACTRHYKLTRLKYDEPRRDLYTKVSVISLHKVVSSRIFHTWQEPITSACGQTRRE